MLKEAEGKEPVESMNMGHGKHELSYSAQANPFISTQSHCSCTQGHCSSNVLFLLPPSKPLSRCCVEEEKRKPGNGLKGEHEFQKFCF